MQAAMTKLPADALFLGFDSSTQLVSFLFPCCLFHSSVERLILGGPRCAVVVAVEEFDI
jgi:hypothetical protein